MAMKNTLVWSAIFVATVGLSACGGGSGSSSSFSDSTSGTTVSGVVADGYLENATVCLDLNANKKCDAGEPTATTASDGSYSFSATQAQIAAAAIVAEIIANVTIDSDIGAAVERAYTLSAPIGKPEFVSPITTLIQAKLELNPSMTPEQAEIGVKNDLGITAGSGIDLYKDFIAAGEAGSEEYKILHQTAQVVARVIATFTATLTDQLDTLGVAISDDDLKDIQKIVAQTVITQLPVIYSSAQQHIEGGGDVSVSFANDTSAATDDSGLSGMTQQEFEKSTQEFEALETSESITPVDAINAGDTVYMNLTSDYNGFSVSYGAFVVSFSENSFDYASVDLNAIVALGSDIEVATRLKDNNSADNVQEVPINKFSDGSISFKNLDGDTVKIFSMAKMDIAGQTFKLKDINEDYYDYGSEDISVTFSEGDISYQIAHSITEDLHLGNIGELADFAALCGTDVLDDDQCSNADNLFKDTSFDALMTSAIARADQIGGSSWSDDTGSYLMYMKDVATETVASCKVNDGPLYYITAPTISDCFANTEVILGNIRTGTLADGTPYLALPDGYFDAESGLERSYDVYTTDGSNIYNYIESFKLDATPEITVAKRFNLSAMKSMFNALP